MEWVSGLNFICGALCLSAFVLRFICVVLSIFFCIKTITGSCVYLLCFSVLFSCQCVLVCAYVYTFSACLFLALMLYVTAYICFIFSINLLCVYVRHGFDAVIKLKLYVPKIFFILFTTFSPLHNSYTVQCHLFSGFQIDSFIHSFHIFCSFSRHFSLRTNADISIPCLVLYGRFYFHPFSLVQHSIWFQCVGHKLFFVLSLVRFFFRIFVFFIYIYIYMCYTMQHI